MDKIKSKRGGARAGAGRPCKYIVPLSEPIAIRLPKELLEKIDAGAKAISTSRTQFIIDVLQSAKI